MEVEMYVYRVDAEFSSSEKSFSYSFNYITPEPIGTNFGRIINLICNEKNVSFKELATNYFDVNIVKISTIK